MLCLGTDYDIHTEFLVPITDSVHVEGVRGVAPTAALARAAGVDEGVFPKMANYILNVYADRDCTSHVGRLGLSAQSDEQAVRQARNECLRWEMAGESRMLVLLRDGCEMARLGSRKFAS